MKTLRTFSNVSKRVSELSTGASFRHFVVYLKINESHRNFILIIDGMHLSFQGIAKHYRWTIFSVSLEHVSVFSACDFQIFDLHVEKEERRCKCTSDAYEKSHETNLVSLCTRRRILQRERKARIIP